MYNQPNFNPYDPSTIPYNYNYPLPPYVNNQQPQHYAPTPYGQEIQQTPFDIYAKPQQPPNWPAPSPMSGALPGAVPNVDPAQGMQQGNGLLHYFQNKDGQMDLDKMLSTVGQIANTYHQVSPIVKQFGSFMKNFR